MGDATHGPRSRADDDRIIDLTASEPAPTVWLLASTGRSDLPPGGAGRWRRRSVANRPVPKGEKHAYRAGDVHTVCGLPLVDLEVWHDERFGDGLLNRCPSCLARTRQAVRSESSSRSLGRTPSSAMHDS
jgi:hypothetical protein